jgi:hypothetical protein
MLDFVKRAFRGFFGVLLWVNLIICAIGGAVLGWVGFLGFLIGVVVGLFTDIIFGGLVTTLLSIDANIEKLVKGDGFISGEKTSAPAYERKTL